MSIHQLKDGRWICQYTKGADPSRPNSNKKYFGRGGEGQAAAREFDTSLKISRKPSTEASPTFTELVNVYLSERQQVIAKSTMFKCINRMRGTILPELGYEMAHSLTPERLAEYAQFRVDGGIKRTTVHRELTDVRAVLRYAVKRRLLAHNPMEGLTMPARDNAIIQPPTSAEFAAILACAVPHLQRAMLVSYFTGLRPGIVELSRLRWDNVDFHGKTLMVVSAVKGGMPSRMIPLCKTILAHLVAWYADDSKSGTPYLIHYNGGPVDCLKTAWKNAKRRAMVTRRLRLYDIRHAFATNLLSAGANLKAVSEILGHASPDMTMRVYQHVDTDLKRRTVDMLDVGVGGVPQ